MQIRFFNITQTEIKYMSEITVDINEQLYINTEEENNLLLLYNEDFMRKILDFFQDCHPKARRIFDMEGMDIYYNQTSLLKDYIGYTIPGCTEYLIQKIIRYSLDYITAKLANGTADFKEVSEAVQLVNTLQNAQEEEFDEDILSYWRQS